MESLDKVSATTASSIGIGGDLSKPGAKRPYRTRNSPERKAIIAQVIPAIRDNVSIDTLAIQHGVNASTLRYWLRHSIDAYHNRLYAITNFPMARDPKKNAFRVRRRLERLVTYRQLHGMPPNPSPGSAKARRMASKDTQ